MAGQIVSAGASLLSGLVGGKGAKKAAEQQAKALQAGIDEQRRQFDVTQANEKPFLDAGTTALGGDGGLLALLGLQGPEAQATAIQALKESPQYTSQFSSGLDALNQSAAATGGLRGGNNALDESNFGADLLRKVLGDQTGALGSLVTMGKGTADSIGQFGANASTSIADMLAKIGGAKASGTLGSTNAWTGAINDIGKFGSMSGGTGGINFAQLLNGAAKF